MTERDRGRLQRAEADADAGADAERREVERHGVGAQPRGEDEADGEGPAADRAEPREARPEHAEPLVQEVVDQLRALGATVATGRFRTEMLVDIANDGPVTVLIEL